MLPVDRDNSCGSGDFSILQQLSKLRDGKLTWTFRKGTDEKNFGRAAET